MPVLPLETGITYGPIRSRRLGLSLGVNLLPSGYKACSYDCIYCHYGRTPHPCMRPDPRDLPWPNQVLRAVESALHQHPQIDYVTFSGNGEPTLHPAFAEIAAGVRERCRALAPGVKLALFSNATMVHVPRVRQALAHFDLPMLKLDVGDPQTWARVNRPAPEVNWERLITGLKQIPDLIIQSVLVDGTVSTVQGAAFETWVATLRAVQPALVQIYSTDYPVPERGLERVPPYRLRHIAAQVNEQTGLYIEPYWV